jgi:uncharacterized membrane protein YkgB
MVVMLLWAGSYKMTVPGAEGTVPLVSNSPLISWHFKLFGPYQEQTESQSEKKTSLTPYFYACTSVEVNLTSFLLYSS